MNGTDIHTERKKLLQEIRSSGRSYDESLVHQASEFAVGLKRNSRYDLTCSLSVARTMVKLRADSHGVAAALLHDVLLHELTDMDTLREKFPEPVGKLVAEVTQLLKINLLETRHSKKESFRKMLLGLAKDLRVVLIRLSHALYWMEHLDRLQEEEKLRFAKETRDVLAPIAGRLGIQWIRILLEDAAFEVLDPGTYRELKSAIESDRSRRKTFVDHILKDLKGMVLSAIPEATIYGREKHLLSTHLKMIRKRIPLDEVFDRLGFRILVNEVGECYQVMGMIHSRWKPLPRQIKDYIAVPKPNGYQSLHTIVQGPEDQILEVQIRTRTMHEIAENGIAAHWKYKESGVTETSAKDRQNVNWLRTIIQASGEENPDEGLPLSMDLFADKVFVFTTRGDVRELPTGATPVDFAFAIHTELGEHCVGAKVNGHIVPFERELENGDVVEILTRANQRPNKEWLEFVKTSKAKSKIRSFLRRAERERAAELGRVELEQTFKRWKLNFSRITKRGELRKAFEKFKVNSAEELAALVGEKKARAEDVALIFMPKEALEKIERQRREEEERRLKKAKARAERRQKSHRSGVSVSGMKNIMVSFAKCCHPVMGDNIKGYITRGRGITIHRTDCKRLTDFEESRVVPANWETEAGVELPVRLRVIAENQTGVLSQLSQTMTRWGINIASVRGEVNESEWIGKLDFVIMVSDLSQVGQVIADLKKEKNVHNVFRID